MFPCLYKKTCDNSKAAVVLSRIQGFKSESTLSKAAMGLSRIRKHFEWVWDGAHLEESGHFHFGLAYACRSSDIFSSDWRILLRSRVQGFKSESALSKVAVGLLRIRKHRWDSKAKARFRKRGCKNALRMGLGWHYTPGGVRTFSLRIGVHL